MGGRAPDLVGIVEALYRFDLSNHAWLELVSGEVSPLIDRDHKGSIAMNVQCDDPIAFSPVGVVEVGVSDGLSAVFRAGLPGIPPEYIADGYLSRPWCSSAELEGWDRIPGVADGAIAAERVADLLVLGAAEPDGRGCWFGSFQTEHRPITSELRAALVHLGAHLTVVNRLRRRIDAGGELTNAVSAVLDPGGRVMHAIGKASEARNVERLSRAAREMDQARSRRGRNDSLHALKAWQDQVSAEWSLVDSFERDGRRYVLAVQSQPEESSFGLLSVREREVVRQALLGRSNKVIAYELGVAQSTVRVLMARAAAKVGAASRRDLLEKALQAEAAVPSRA